MLRILHDLPADLLNAQAFELNEILGGPTLIHLEGARGPDLFISVLQHGNEVTGWLAVQNILNKYRSGEGRISLPRSLSLFIANVAAAEPGMRQVRGQPDFNRLWPGGIEQDRPEAQMMAEVTGIMKRRGVFASLDMHNNSGRHPLYACVNRLDAAKLALAAEFNTDIVYFINPTGVQSMAFGEFCTAITLECGQPDELAGIKPAIELIDHCMTIDRIDIPEGLFDRIRILRTIATVTIDEDCSFGFGRTQDSLQLRDNLEDLNFSTLPAGTTFGTTGAQNLIGMTVRDEQDKIVTGAFFENVDGRILLRQSVIPAMLTKDKTIIRDDCLCYLMVEISPQLTPAD